MTKQQKELAAIAASISRYYDSLTDEEVEEQRLWGQFSESQTLFQLSGDTIGASES